MSYDDYSPVCECGGEIYVIINEPMNFVLVGLIEFEGICSECGMTCYATYCFSPEATEEGTIEPVN